MSTKETTKIWLVGLAILQLVTLIIVGVLFSRGGQATLTKPGGEEAEKALTFAEMLYTQELYESAASEFGSVLNTYLLPDPKAAAIAYKVGEIYLDKVGLYPQALSFFLKAENLDREGKLSQSISQRKIECLERMKRTSDAQRVLEESALLDPQSVQRADATAVVAEVGQEKITVRQLDNQIDLLPDELRQQFTTNRAKKIEFLQQYVATKLIYNAAQRKGYARDPEIVQALAQYEKNVLVQKYISQEIGETIQFTPSDVQLYYEANKDKYDQKPYSEVQEQVALEFQQVKYREALALLFERLSAAENVTLYPENVTE